MKPTAYKTRRVIAVFLLMFTMSLSALAADKPVDDNYLYDSVREKLASDPIVKGGVIDVDVKAGVVTLTGHVQDSKQKEKAESLAKKVKGVKSVVNSLQIIAK